MEKKTIGGFISALRKANGMTQKDLAERLNVSDKTVSRWERDDGGPDLAAIPVIAEIFDVTCDELLRGERKPPEARTGDTEEPESTSKGEKQRLRLLKSTLSQYRNRTYIAMGASVAGLIVALIGNLAFLSAVLGFLVGAIFFVASIVCQAVFVNKAFLSVEDAGLDEAALSLYKRKVIALAQKSIGLTVCFLGFTFPLILVDAYYGLGSDSLLIWGSMGAGAFLLVYVVALYFLTPSLLKKGVYTLSERDWRTYHNNRRLKKKCTIGLVVVYAVTLGFQVFGGEMIWSAQNLSASYGITFEDYESFTDYMAQPLYYDEHGWLEPQSIQQREETRTWYDDGGNEISEEEALTRTLEDKNGNVVCTYVARNEGAVLIHCTPGDGTVLPITVVSNDDLVAARSLHNLINLIYCVLYLLEMAGAVWFYYKKREA